MRLVGPNFLDAKGAEENLFIVLFSPTPLTQLHNRGWTLTRASLSPRGRNGGSNEKAGTHFFGLRCRTWSAELGRLGSPKEAYKGAN